MPSIRAVQVDVAQWTGHNFPDVSLGIAALGTSEEIGELAEVVLGLVAAYGRVSRAIVKGDQNIRGGADRWRNELPKEIADCFIKLCDVANLSGVDLESAVAARWSVVRERGRDSAAEAQRGPQAGLTIVGEST